MGIDTFMNKKWIKNSFKGTWEEAQRFYPNILKREKSDKGYKYTKIEALTSSNPKARKFARKEYAFAFGIKK